MDVCLDSSRYELQYDMFVWLAVNPTISLFLILLGKKNRRRNIVSVPIASAVTYGPVHTVGSNPTRPVYLMWVRVSCVQGPGLFLVSIVQLIIKYRAPEIVPPLLSSFYMDKHLVVVWPTWLYISDRL